MEVIKRDGSCPIFSWCPEVEGQAKEQIELIASLPYARSAALMPDAHWGQNMCIGGVVACDNVVVPDFVGVDIGCGMGAIKTSVNAEYLDEDRKKRILHSMSRGIPVGFAHNSQKRANELKNRHKEKIDYIIQKSKIHEVVQRTGHNPVGNYEKVVYEQLGTLGGGNHFVEVQHDEDGFVWVMLHSGSRNMGKKIGDYFNQVAFDLNKKFYSDAKDIPFLPTDTEDGKAYLAWMEFALHFAFLSRQVMLEEAKRTLEYECPDIQWKTKDVCDDSKNDLINIHHNFAQLESHFGKNLWVHRKGATMARKGLTGIIPGSMGTSSYIVRGKGEEKSLMSCSHGAGRHMGRMAYCRKMKDSLDEVEKSLEGVTHSGFGTVTRGKNKGMLDVSEAPGAYKDIEEVMGNQSDLVDAIVKLKPMIVLKG